VGGGRENLQACRQVVVVSALYGSGSAGAPQTPVVEVCNPGSNEVEGNPGGVAVPGNAAERIVTCGNESNDGRQKRGNEKR